ncbi:MAG: tRNA pseudouridine(54/55) synthase Pus10 [Halobaculum sp.]
MSSDGEPVAVARRVTATGPVCDHCLGRVFADRSFGLGNAERGRAMRTALALADDEPYDPPEPADCWVCEGLYEHVDRFAARAVAAVADHEFATYQVGSRVSGLLEENDRLLRADAGLDPEAGEPARKELNREIGKRIADLTGAEVDFERPHVQFLVDTTADSPEPTAHDALHATTDESGEQSDGTDESGERSNETGESGESGAESSPEPLGRVEATVNSAFVYGRYRKLERGVPQTEWPCSDCEGTGRDAGRACPACDGTGYRYRESVEQLTAPVVERVMDGVGSSFHGAGREDVDARMLGTGRPFVVEVAEPRRRAVDTARLEADVNAFADGTVEVEGLRRCRHTMVERVKELPASKQYRAEVAFDTDVSSDALAAAVERLSGATIEQYTPNRVDHRRAGKTRTREAYEVTADREGPRAATVEIHGEGGLYVKELVSGDEGRTEPSLAGELGVGAEVTALDVVAVEGEDEPFEDEAYFLD